MCTKCGDSGFRYFWLGDGGVEVPPDQCLGVSLDFCDCPLGQGERRDFEAACTNVCPCCGRPGAYLGCETCAAMADEAYAER